jgi:hypothetical protein
MTTPIQSALGPARPLTATVAPIVRSETLYPHLKAHDRGPDFRDNPQFAGLSGAEEKALIIAGAAPRGAIDRTVRDAPQDALQRSPAAPVAIPAVEALADDLAALRVTVEAQGVTLRRLRDAVDAGTGASCAVCGSGT